MGVKPNRPKYYPPPKAGWYFGELNSVEDLGELDTNWGKRPTVKLTWLFEDELREDGQPQQVTKLYNNSLHEKANLYALVESLVGEVPEDPDWELDDLIGIRCHFKIGHKDSTKRSGQKFAVIEYVEADSNEASSESDPPDTSGDTTDPCPF